MMGVFNNLTLFDQNVKKVSLQSIVPDLASAWAWGEDGLRLTFQLRHGVKWHDGQPFTAKDVVCTYELRMDRGPEKLRVINRAGRVQSCGQQRRSHPQHRKPTDLINRIGQHRTSSSSRVGCAFATSDEKEVIAVGSQVGQ
jgi:Bacterial extracellular solute-binding proteins, family 5 Middle